MKNNNMFDKKLEITTDNDTIIIEKKQILIHGSFSFEGEAYVMSYLNEKDNKNVYIVREIYSYDDDRLRFSYDVYLNAKAFNTIERVEEGTEVPVFVIESCDDVKRHYIGSIGNIKTLVSDKQPAKQEKNKILELIRKNKSEQKVA